MYKVLIVEDEVPIMRGLLCAVSWPDLDCQIVATGQNGQEGLELIQMHKPDIVIMDINMPLLSGLDMMRQTYEKYLYSAIVLSGYSSFNYAQKAMEYGAVRYLLKPLRKEELIEAIREAKEQRELRKIWAQRKEEQKELRDFSMNLEFEGGDFDPVVRDMMDFAAKHYKEKVTLQDVANALNYSISFLNKRFKNQTGVTYIEYLNRYRIQKALELMKDGKMPLQEVSWQCGIGDYKYFNSVFRKYLGCSPKEYMKQISNWLN